MGPQIVIFSITIENVDNAKPEVLELPLARWRLNQGQGSHRSSLPKSWASLNLLSVALRLFDEYEIHSKPHSTCVGFSLPKAPTLSPVEEALLLPPVDRLSSQERSPNWHRAGWASTHGGLFTQWGPRRRSSHPIPSVHPSTYSIEDNISWLINLSRPLKT